ncbi:MAG: phenylacetate--CoA ligase family protein, partial [Humidesulfovibrio sp.]|nr:phenylacetate--CoA ligase family protein [Humidesulfovibrio sp.]
QRFEEALGLEHSFDISGMTEIYGPGAGIECEAHQGIHYWADLYILELIDPETLQPVAPGELGEMVITSLKKEASPLIRYRTRDMTRLIPGVCPCGCGMPRHERIQGRSDDMIIFRGVNIYPGQVAAVLERHPQMLSEYQILLSRSEGLDHMVVRAERRAGTCSDEQGAEAVALAKAISEDIKNQILVTAKVEVLAPGTLPRSFAKTKRVIDDREID